jgi:RNA polymerase sigma-70 factor, ECF subfamily
VEGVSRDERFVQALTTSQGRLQAYIYCLLGNVHDASTVLQETNLVLWRKIDTFPEIQSFDAWSREIAYYQALAFLRDRKRDKLIFSQQTIDAVWEARNEVEFDERRLALRDCVSQLSGEKREVIQKFYMENKKVRQIAVELEKSEGAVKMCLKRARLALMNCVTKRMELAG